MNPVPAEGGCNCRRGASVFWERIKKTRKQRNKNVTKNIIVFLLNNFIWANRKGEKKLFFLPIGRNKIVHQENKKILDKILASLFSCF